MTGNETYPAGVTISDHIAHDMKQGRFPKRSTIEEFLSKRPPYQTAAFQNTDDGDPALVLAALRHCASSWEGEARLLGNVRAKDIVRAIDTVVRPDETEALRLLAAEDERQSKLHDLLETIREQIRLEVAPEHRPDELFKNIQDAVYAMRGRTALMDDAAITSPLSHSRALRGVLALPCADEAAIRADGSLRVTIPTATMEQEFQSHYQRGYEAGCTAEREKCAKVCDRWKRSKNLHESLAADNIQKEIRASAIRNGGKQP